MGQRRTAAYRRGGCNLNRDIADLVRQRFLINELETGYLPGPKVAGHLGSGTAT